MSETTTVELCPGCNRVASDHGDGIWWCGDVTCSGMTPVPAELSDERLAARVREIVSEMCKGDRWRMCIPPQPDDSDLAITDLLDRFWSTRSDAQLREAAIRWADAEDAYYAHDTRDLRGVADLSEWGQRREDLHEARMAAQFDALREARALATALSQAPGDTR